MLTTVVTNLALNTVSEATVEPQAQVIVVSNRSYFDLAVYFDPMVMSKTAASPVGAGTVVVHPRHVARITLSNGQAAGYANFIGKVYLHPVMATTNYASTGTISAPTTAFVTSLVQGDDLSVSADAMSYDAQSQQRVVMLPSVSTCTFLGFHTWVGNENLILTDATGSQGGSFIASGAIGAKWAIIYLYRVNFTVLTAGTGQNLMQIVVREYNNNGVAPANEIAGHVIHEFGWVTGGTAPYTPPLTSPVHMDFFTQAACTYLSVSITNGNGTSIQLSYDIGIDVGYIGTNPQVVPYSIGGGALGVVSGLIGNGGPF